MAIFLILSPTLAFASQAGIVIKKQNGTVKSSCVAFDGSSISGMQLLQNSGFNPVVKNGFIVSIDGVGDKDSSQMSKDDLFWSYWKLKNGAWSFQNSGANYSRVNDGEVEGWEFGHGTSSLPQITFERICQKIKTDESTKFSGNITPSQDNNNTATVEQITASQTSVSVKIADKAPISTQTIVPGQTDTQSSANVKGDNDQRSTTVFPEFSLKNIAILFLIFIAFGAIFIFVKLAVKKICK